MSEAIRTKEFLQTSVFQSGQSRGVTSRDLRDLVATAYNRTTWQFALDEFGTVGDGENDDTGAFQAALNSPNPFLIGRPGATYLIDGTLQATVSKTIILDHCTVKLKDNASTARPFQLRAPGIKLLGGTIDANRQNGNTPENLYQALALEMMDDDQLVDGLKIINAAGAGIKIHAVNRPKIRNFVLTDTLFYGIYGEAATESLIDPEISDFWIDSSGGGPIGQAILLTRQASGTLTGYLVTRGKIFGPTGTFGSQPINIAIRGHDGEVSHITTYGGSMGFSEGGNNCRAMHNRFLDLEGTFKCGLEFTGTFLSTSNLVTGTSIGLLASNGVDYPLCKSIGDTFISDDTGYKLEPQEGYSLSDMAIVGPTVVAETAILAKRNCQGLNINGGILRAAQDGVGNALFLDTPVAAAHVSIADVGIKGFARPYAVYSATPVTVTDLHAASNTTGDSVMSSEDAWYASGSASLGDRVRVVQT